MYQVWDKDNVDNMNDQRGVAYVPAKIWVRAFNQTNAFLDKNSKPLFTPTTIMEIENDNYVFVIEKAYLNSNDRVVFIVSTKDISLQKNTSKKLIDIPCGKHVNVRFDIDTPARDSCYFGCYASVAFSLGLGALGFDYCKSTCPN